MNPATARERNHAISMNDVAEKGLPARGFGVYEPTIRKHERLVGRSAPKPAVASPSGSLRLNPSFVEWMMCLPENWVCNHGLSRRQELQALGNGVVPIQAAVGIYRDVRLLQHIDGYQLEPETAHEKES